jgi:peptidoglycan/LPS O-acetylase OafA/YrhL
VCSAVVADHFLGFSCVVDAVEALLAAFVVGLTRPVLNRWLRSLTAAVAKYSCGIYLFHLPVMSICLGRKTWPEVAMVFCAVGALSAAAYHGIEAPFIRLGVKLSKTAESLQLANSAHVAG